MAVNASTRSHWPPIMTLRGSRMADRLLARWGIILAGGEGARMRPLISQWLGGARPKQYCTFTGSRSMIQHTIDRARAVVSENNVVTIIGRGHRKFLTDSANGNVPGRVLEQPVNLGTAPGVFLPIAYVLADSPEATIALLPSDHFVHPEDRFCDHIVHAFELAEKHADQIILVGAIPDRAETDYGWIQPVTRSRGNGAATHGPVKVMRFREKPEVDEAHSLFRQGCLWNTMVITTKAKTLWGLGRELLPEMMREFDAYLMVLRAVRDKRLAPDLEAIALARVYDALAPADFSKDILQHVSEQSMVLRMDGVTWCDWGRPRRLAETLAGLCKGAEVRFPLPSQEAT